MKIYFDRRWEGTCPMSPPPHGCASTYIMNFCSKVPANHRHFQGDKNWSFLIAFPVIFFCQCSLQQTKFSIFLKTNIVFLNVVHRRIQVRHCGEMNTFSIDLLSNKNIYFLHYRVSLVTTHRMVCTFQVL